MDHATFGKIGFKLSSARIKDLAVQSCFLLHLFARLRYRPLCTCRHAFGFQVFQKNKRGGRGNI